MMIPWYRVFAANADMPDPTDLHEFLAGRYASVSGDFAEDASGWYRADLVVEGVALQVERFVAGEVGIRAELNSWAAWLETHGNSPDHVALMERMIQTAQLITLRGEDSERSEEVCVGLCRYLAATMAGVYQIDERGFFTADGRLLIAE